MAIIKLLHKSHKSFINFQFDKKFGTMRYFPGCCSLLWEVCTARNMFLLNIGVILMPAQLSDSSCLAGFHFFFCNCHFYACSHKNCENGFSLVPKKINFFKNILLSTLNSHTETQRPDEERIVPIEKKIGPWDLC